MKSKDLAPLHQSSRSSGRATQLPSGWPYVRSRARRNGRDHTRTFTGGISGGQDTF